jgi:hypothetical protein
VRFHTEHLFPAPMSAVLALLSDAAFYLALTLPDLSQPELLEERQDDESTVLRLRYEFVGSLDPIAQRLIGSGRLAWIQEVRVDRSTGTGELRFEAEKDPRRLHGSAQFVFSESQGVTTRKIDGDLVVAIPGVGRMAERRIVPGLVNRLAIEAQAVNDRLG